MSKDLNLEKKIKRRALLLGISKSFFTLLVFGNLYYLQILQKSKYGKLSDLNRTKVKILYPERGIIFDLYDKPIASNKVDYQLSIFREKKNLINKYINNLKGHINFDQRDLSEIKTNLNQQDLSDFITIKTRLSWNELEFFEFMRNKFPYLKCNYRYCKNHTSNKSDTPFDNEHSLDR